MDEEAIINAPRHPVIITAKCPKNHSLAVFVDASFKILDVESTAGQSIEEKDAVDKTKGWFDSL